MTRPPDAPCEPVPVVVAIPARDEAAWLPGTEGGGVADTLYGRAGFTGRLPVTWPNTNAQVPVGRPRDAGRPMFPYGAGLTR